MKQKKIFFYSFLKIIITALSFSFNGKLFSLCYFGIFSIPFSLALAFDERVFIGFSLALLVTSCAWIVFMVFDVFKNRKLKVVARFGVLMLTVIDIFCIVFSSASSTHVPWQDWAYRICGIIINMICTFFLVRSLKQSIRGRQSGDGSVIDKE